MTGNYDNSSSFYDWLSQLVFGKALINAQVYFLRYIPANATILIAGGGTGWILEEITNIHSSGLDITYVELSQSMLALSQKRHTGLNRMNYINGAIEEIELADKFDVVITPFLFDNFTDTTLAKVFTHLHATLKPGGLWLNTDFQLTGKWWQYILLKTMLLFFKIICGVESWGLPNVAGQYKKFNYKIEDQKTFFKDFIITIMYRNPI